MSAVHVLCINWNLAEDQLSFDVTFVIRLMHKLEPKKRNIVSLATRIYNPLGIISPLTVQFCSIHVRPLPQRAASNQ